MISLTSSQTLSAKHLSTTHTTYLLDHCLTLAWKYLTQCNCIAQHWTLNTELYVKVKSYPGRPTLGSARSLLLSSSFLSRALRKFQKVCEQLFRLFRVRNAPTKGFSYGHISASASVSGPLLPTFPSSCSITAEPARSCQVFSRCDLCFINIKSDLLAMKICARFKTWPVLFWLSCQVSCMCCCVLFGTRL